MQVQNVLLLLVSSAVFFISLLFFFFSYHQAILAKYWITSHVCPLQSYPHLCIHILNQNPDALQMQVRAKWRWSIIFRSMKFRLHWNAILHRTMNFSHWVPLLENFESDLTFFLLQRCNTSTDNWNFKFSERLQFKFGSNHRSKSVLNLDSHVESHPHSTSYPLFHQAIDSMY